MKRITILLFALLSFTALFAQEKTATYDGVLAKSLNADEYGMKKYVFCLLKTGPYKAADAGESQKLFDGHMALINRLAADGQLTLAGPFMKNDRDYRGIYIFNVGSVDEAATLTQDDPAVKAGLFVAEFTEFYCSAALQQVNDTHNRIQKTKF